MYFYRYFFNIIIFISIISTIHTFSIEKTHNDIVQVKKFIILKIKLFVFFFLKVSRRQVGTATLAKQRNPHQKQEFVDADKHQLPLHKETYILTMLPEDAGDHAYNKEGNHEWEVQANKDTVFAIYGN